MFPFRSQARCMEHALVLRALDIDFEFAPHDAGIALIVPVAQAGHAREQLDLYDSENRQPAFTPRPVRGGADGRPAVVAWVGVLLVAAWLQTNHAGGYDWLYAGRMQAGLVGDGQWWRIFTALTLHLDLPHLVGNLIFGALFVLVAAHALGAGVALLSVVGAGAAGNALNALIQSPAHSAVGASTSVFAALGILAVFFDRQRRSLAGPERERWPLRWGPVIGGVMLLAFLGVGGERTDIMAHVTGFVCGGLLGYLCGKLAHGGRLERIPQLAAAAAAAGVLGVAWAMALTAGAPSPAG